MDLSSRVSEVFAGIEGIKGLRKWGCGLRLVLSTSNLGFEPYLL